jgi:hypothetical protein
MKVFRGIISTLLVLIGAAALAAGSVLWWTDGHVFDTATFTESTSKVLRDPQVQTLLSREITNKVMAYVESPELQPQVRLLVTQIVASEEALTLMDQGVVDAHRLLVDGTAPTLDLNLIALATEVRVRIVAAAPLLDATLPPPNNWFEFQLLKRTDLPKTYELVERFHSSAVALLFLGAALIGLALVLGPGRWALMMGSGLGVAAFGIAIVFALKKALQEGEARVTDPVAKAASKNVFSIFFHELNRQSITLIVIGGIVALLGVSIGLIRPEYMREKDPWSSDARRKRR